MIRIVTVFLFFLLVNFSFSFDTSDQHEKELRQIVENYEIEDHDLRKGILRKYLIGADLVKSPGPEYITIGFIASNVHKKGLVDGILRVFGNYLKSIFLYSSGTPIHMVIITDAGSYKPLYHFMYNIIGAHLAELIIYEHTIDTRNDWLRLATFPKLKVEFVDILSITSPRRKEIDAMKLHYSIQPRDFERFKKNTLNGNTIVLSPKYQLDLFYMAPFYFEAFAQIDRLIMFDVDLKTDVDIGELYTYFDTMNSTEMIAVVADQADFYYTPSTYIQQFNSDKLMTTDKEKLKGLNTGVVLYDLDKMRKSEEYKKIITTHNLTHIKADLGIPEFTMTVGDQEWMTCAVWRYPQFFKMLPCEYNIQDTPVIKLENRCDKPGKIYHEHGQIHEKKKVKH